MMVLLVIIVFLFALGFLGAKKSLECSLLARRILFFSAGTITAVLFCMAIPGPETWVECPRLVEFLAAEFLLLSPFLLGGALGLNSALGKALESASAEAERQKQIANQQYKYCPACATPLERKQDGEGAVLDCPSCTWVHEVVAR